jgi:hypothetical protein
MRFIAKTSMFHGRCNDKKQSGTKRAGKGWKRVERVERAKKLLVFGPSIAS